MTTKFIRVEITRTMEISSDKVPQLAFIDDAEQVWNDDNLKETLIKLTEEEGKFETIFPEFWSEEDEVLKDELEDESD